MLKQKNKSNISKSVFYASLAISAIIITLIVVNGIIYAYSVDKLNAFLQNRGYTSATRDDGEKYFRLINILKIIFNSIIFVFFALYAYFAFTKIEVGTGFVLFWGLVFVGNIIASWLVPGTDLWVKVIMTIVSSFGLMTLFLHFVLLNQLKFYNKNKQRWGAG